MYLSKHQLESGKAFSINRQKGAPRSCTMKDFYSQNGIGTRKLTRQKIKSVIAKLLSFTWCGDPGSISRRAGTIRPVWSWGLVKATPFGACDLGCNSFEIRAWTCSFSLCPPSSQMSTVHMQEKKLSQYLLSWWVYSSWSTHLALTPPALPFFRQSSASLSHWFSPEEESFSSEFIQQIFLDFMKNFHHTKTEWNLSSKKKI